MVIGSRESAQAEEGRDFGKRRPIKNGEALFPMKADPFAADGTDQDRNDGAHPPAFGPLAGSADRDGLAGCDTCASKDLLSAARCEPSGHSYDRHTPALCEQALSVGTLLSDHPRNDRRA